jgi:hypothetical protein
MRADDLDDRIHCIRTHSLTLTLSLPQTSSRSHARVASCASVSGIGSPLITHAPHPRRPVGRRRRHHPRSSIMRARHMAAHHAAAAHAALPRTQRMHAPCRTARVRCVRARARWRERERASEHERNRMTASACARACACACERVRRCLPVCFPLARAASSDSLTVRASQHASRTRSCARSATATSARRIAIPTGIGARAAGRARAGERRLRRMAAARPTRVAPGAL